MGFFLVGLLEKSQPSSKGTVIAASITVSTQRQRHHTRRNAGGADQA